MIQKISLLVMAALLAACQNLILPPIAPTLTLESIAPDRSAGLVPTLQVGMRVENPNLKPLKLRGLEYRIALEGFNVVSGSSSALPVIPAQGDALVTIEAKLGLLEGAKLLAALLSQPKRELGFSLEAALDTGLPLIGAIPVRQRGIIDMQTYEARLYTQ